MRTKLITILMVFLLPVSVYAVDIQQSGSINDFVGVIKDDHKTALTKAIEDLSQKTSAEVVVVTINSASPDNGEEYKASLFENWKIGKKGNQDNGLLFLLVLDENKYYIAGGSDFDDLLTDNILKEIDTKYLTPNFRKKDYDQGIFYGVSELIKVIEQPAGSLNTKQLKSKDFLQEVSQKINNSLDSGKNAKALIYAQEAVRVASNIYGNNSAEKAQFLSSLGNAYWLLKKNEEAEVAFKESFDIYEKTVPKDSIEFANANKRLGGIYLLEKKYAEAKPLFEKSLSIEEKLLGKDHQNNVATRKYLAKINEKLGEQNRKGEEQIPKISATSKIATHFVKWGNRLPLACLVLFYFFITILGVLKGAENKAIFFNSPNDYKINLAIGIIFLIFILAEINGIRVKQLPAMPTFLSFTGSSDPKIIYPALAIVIFSAINILEAYYINRITKLKLIPLAVGFSRTIMVFFVPILEGLRFICIVIGCMQDSRAGKTKEEGSAEKSSDTRRNWFLEFEEGLQHFIGSTPYVGQGILINIMSVTLAKAVNTCGKMDDFIKEHSDVFEEVDRNISEGVDFEDPDNKFEEKTDWQGSGNSDNGSSANTATDDLQSAYEILGISSNATRDEIKKAYRHKIMGYHPDRTGGLGEKLRAVAEEEAKRINGAYEKIMKAKNEK